MAPQNRRIVTLRDIESNDTQRQGGSHDFADAAAAADDDHHHHDDNDNSVGHHRWNSLKPTAMVAWSPPYPEPNPLSSSFCQPVPKAPTTIPLLHISKMADHLSMAEACRQTLERVYREFEPIIRRRGYNVQSISELCCCGDGLDEMRQGRGRPLRKQPDNVWGYNQTTFLRRGGGRLMSSTSHTIHLRLRQPRHHATQLLSWENVAGTMAHELSHCVHQNHSKHFYQLMEDILEEHATNQIHSMGSLIYGGCSGPSLAPPPPPPTITATAKTLGFPTGGGQRLGGNSCSNKGLGKSRLLSSGVGGGHHLNPKCSSGTNSPTALSPRALREAMARAAENRRKQMEQLRRMIAASREPCVIEILDDGVGAENGLDGGLAVSSSSSLDHKSSDVKRRATARNECPYQGRVLSTNDKNDSIVDITAFTPRVMKKHKVSAHQETIDLTSPTKTSIDQLFVVGAAAAASPVVVSCPAIHIPISANQEWNCPRCTFHNRPSALVCEMCREGKIVYLPTWQKSEGPIEID